MEAIIILILFIPVIAFFAAIIALIYALITYFTYKNDAVNNQKYKSSLKTGLIALLIVGISVLLLATLCS